MKKMPNRSCLLAILLLAHGVAGAADAAAAKARAAVAARQAPAERAAIRVLCEGKYANAEVSVNGVLKGECPLDLAVAPGLIQIRASKNRDEYYDQVFEQSFTLGADVAKRVEVAFNKRPQLRADAVARIDKQVDASESAQESKRRNEIPALENAAANGDAAAMARLGLFWYRGLAGQADLKKAVEWYRKGADAGNAEAMYVYAIFLERGRLVPENRPLAVGLYQKSAAQGYPQALEKLGDIVNNGSDGFQKDSRLAGSYYKKAAEGGAKLSPLWYWSTLPEAEQDAGLATQTQLELMAARVQVQKAQTGEDLEALMDAASTYTFGVQGYKTNHELALTYYRMAWRQKVKTAAAGDADSNYDLAYWSEGGIGTNPDRTVALRYYKQAQQAGHPKAAEAVKRLQALQGK